MRRVSLGYHITTEESVRKYIETQNNTRLVMFPLIFIKPFFIEELKKESE